MSTSQKSSQTRQPQIKVVKGAAIILQDYSKFWIKASVPIFLRDIFDEKLGLIEDFINDITYGCWGDFEDDFHESVDVGWDALGDYMADDNKYLLIGLNEDGTYDVKFGDSDDILYILDNEGPFISTQTTQTKEAGSSRGVRVKVKDFIHL
jgi:hypothetical protein